MVGQLVYLVISWFCVVGLKVRIQIGTARRNVADQHGSGVIKEGGDVSVNLFERMTCSCLVCSKVKVTIH